MPQRVCQPPTLQLVATTQLILHISDAHHLSCSFPIVRIVGTGHVDSAHVVLFHYLSEISVRKEVEIRAAQALYICSSV